MALRVFTPAQANKTLPLVQRIVRDILAHGAELRQLATGGRTDTATLDRAHELDGQIHTLIAELAEIGCDYKGWGFEKGLVDFPGFLDGQPVLLCWRSDEPAIAWFHAPEAGYAGRQRIPVELLEEAAEA
jgi:hypothetical protein